MRFKKIVGNVDLKNGEETCEWGKNGARLTDVISPGSKSIQSFWKSF